MFRIFLFILLFVSCLHAKLSITSATPSGTIFKSGESMQLQCSSNNPWFLCIWETPSTQKEIKDTKFKLINNKLSGGISCQCQLQNGVTTSACNGDSRVQLSGTGNTCSMSISGGVSGEDAGGYKCVLSDSADFQTTSRSIDALVSECDI